MFALGFTFAASHPSKQLFVRKDLLKEDLWTWKVISDVISCSETECSVPGLHAGAVVKVPSLGSQPGVWNWPSSFHPIECLCLAFTELWRKTPDFVSVQFPTFHHSGPFLSDQNPEAAARTTTFMLGCYCDLGGFERNSDLKGDETLSSMVTPALLEEVGVSFWVTGILQTTSTGSEGKNSSIFLPSSPSFHRVVQQRHLQALGCCVFWRSGKRKKPPTFEEAQGRKGPLPKNIEHAIWLEQLQV